MPETQPSVSGGFSDEDARGLSARTGCACPKPDGHLQVRWPQHDRADAEPATEPTSTFLLGASDIRRLVTMKDVIQVVRTGSKGARRGRSRRRAPSRLAWRNFADGRRIKGTRWGCNETRLGGGRQQGFWTVHHPGARVVAGLHHPPARCLSPMPPRSRRCGPGRFRESRPKRLRRLKHRCLPWWARAGRH